MIFITVCVLVRVTKIASASEGLTIMPFAANSAKNLKND